MKNTSLEKYKELLDLPYTGSSARPHMSMVQRAAQFLPFAALTGYDNAISETARLTDERIQLDNSVKEEIDRTLREINKDLASAVDVIAVYFLPDHLKNGGAYVQAAGIVKKIDFYEKKLIFTNGTIIPIDDLFQLTIHQA